MNCVDDCKYREMLDDANSDLQEMKDENAKLRYKVHILECGNKVLQILNNSAKAKNAKLRELVRDMHRWMGKAVYDGSVREYEYRDFGLVLRELGIDADDEDGYEAEDD